MLGIRPLALEERSELRLRPTSRGELDDGPEREVERVDLDGEGAGPFEPPPIREATVDTFAMTRERPRPGAEPQRGSRSMLVFRFFFGPGRPEAFDEPVARFPAFF